MRAEPVVTPVTFPLLPSQLPAGTLIAIINSIVQASITVPSAKTTVKSLHITTNSFTTIKARFFGYVQFSATSVKQIISLSVNKASGGTLIGSVYQLEQGAASVAQFIPFSVGGEVVDLAPSGDNFTLSAQAPAADANTTVFCNYGEVIGVV